MFNCVTGLVNEHGYVAIMLLMFLENVFPPIPSELIMPMAGFSAVRGDLTMIGVVLSGTVGSLAGASLWYMLGRWFGRERLMSLARRRGKWLTVSPDDVDRAQDWFARHGTKAVLFGRLLPAVRTLISLPAGISRMPVTKFLAYSAVGTMLWSGLLAWAGYLLGDQHESISAYLNPASNGVMFLIGGTYVYRLIRGGR